MKFHSLCVLAFSRANSHVKQWSSSGCDVNKNWSWMSDDKHINHRAILNVIFNKSQHFYGCFYTLRALLHDEKHFNFKRFEIWFSSFLWRRFWFTTLKWADEWNFSVDKFSGKWQIFNKLIIWLDHNLHLLIIFLSFKLTDIEFCRWKTNWMIECSIWVKFFWEIHHEIHHEKHQSTL